LKLSVIGCGYLGAVHAAAMAELGHDVIAIDVDQAKIDMLSSAQAPFFEPGLPEILNSALKAGRLTFTTDMSKARDASVHFIAVGTPQQAGSNSADMTFVNAAVDSLIPFLDDTDVVVGKSTVPVGTAERLETKLREAGSRAAMVWNPEFLREGFALKDTITPDRLVFGINKDLNFKQNLDVMKKVFSYAISEGTPVVVTDRNTAELVKIAANSFLATKISFINAMSEIAEATGANVTELADAIGYDERIGRKFLNAGIGFGGGCLPKDIRAFMARAEDLGLAQSVSFLGDVDQINLRQRQRVINKVISMMGSDLSGSTVAVLGLAFKPQSDDIRDSPALDVAHQLAKLGARVRSFDPEAIPNAQRVAPELSFADSVETVLEGADIAVLVTEWPEFVSLDPHVVGNLMNHKRMVDARNVLNVSQWREAGFTFESMGRP
jgi:UDPglucose 6-dehydrogenase